MILHLKSTAGVQISTLTFGFFFGGALNIPNMYIKFKGNCLVKVNWIKSGIIFIYDILDEYGHISEYKIIAKLRNKQNWISELNILKKAIPKQWTDILITQDSIKPQVVPQKYIKIAKNQMQNLSLFTSSLKNLNIFTFFCFWFEI
jgi:hypothetical protein